MNKSSIVLLLTAFMGLIAANPVIKHKCENQTDDSEQAEASTHYTNSFESELGPEHVFDIETRDTERLRTENGREYYQASLSFELTDFGERIAEGDPKMCMR